MFAKTLLTWFASEGRSLPWRETKDPYVIWLSEIILQQTRVAQGLPYFVKFLDKYPSVCDFANADLDEVLRLWQGLGYYSRARNMHFAAQQVMEQFNGVFPSAYDDLLTLKGIGEYTAAAVSSFSAREVRAVVDGNVYRVLSRYFGIETPVNSTLGKKQFFDLAARLIDPDRPGDYNQAIMDFGALQCKPVGPNCKECVLNIDCEALKANSVNRLPVKIKKKNSINRYFHYFIVRKGDHILMSQRGENDVWARLFEFPYMETKENLSLSELMGTPIFNTWFDSPSIIQLGSTVKHVLSHQNIFANFYLLENEKALKVKKDNWNYYLSYKIDKLAKHKLIFGFLEKYNI